MTIEARFEEGAAKGTVVLLGETDDDGRLAVEVSDVDVPSPECGLEAAPFGTQATLLVGGSPSGRVSLRRRH